MRGNSRIEVTRPVRSGLRPPPRPTSTGTRRGRVFRTVSGGFLPELVQHETRATCTTRHIIGPSLVSRFSGGAVAPTRASVRAVVGLRAADSPARARNPDPRLSRLVPERPAPSAVWTQSELERVTMPSPQ